MARFDFRHSSPFWLGHHFSIQIILVASCLAAQLGTAAAADTWTVVQQAGAAVLRSADGQEMPLKAGAVLSEGTSVKTGADGGCLLRHNSGADTITVLPLSEFKIPGPHRQGQTDIIESSGSLFFHIEHKPGRRFEVDGPYFVTVVKGTAFLVTIANTNSTVEVSEGTVEVQSPDFGQSVLVGAGQFAYISASGRHDLSVGQKQSSATLPPENPRNTATLTNPANLPASGIVSVPAVAVPALGGALSLPNIRLGIVPSLGIGHH